MKIKILVSILKATKIGSGSVPYSKMFRIRNYKTGDAGRGTVGTAEGKIIPYLKTTSILKEEEKLIASRIRCLLMGKSSKYRINY